MRYAPHCHYQLLPLLCHSSTSQQPVFHIFLFDAMKMTAVGEQWPIRCRKLHMTWWTLETTTTCRSLLYTTHTGTPLWRTVSNTNMSEPSENHSSPSLRNVNIYIWRDFAQGSIPKYILIAPAVLYCLSSWIPKNQRTNTMHHITVPWTFEAVSICGSLGVQPISAMPLASLRLAPTMLCICLVDILGRCIASWGDPEQAEWAAINAYRIYTHIKWHQSPHPMSWRQIGKMEEGWHRAPLSWLSLLQSNLSYCHHDNRDKF